MELQRIYIDTHVHIYGIYETRKMLETVYNHFMSYIHSEESSHGCIFCLVLTEAQSEDYFSRLLDETWYEEYAPQWYPRRTAEDSSLWICQDDHIKILVIAGRQIVTRENLEVLALGSAVRYEDGRAIYDVIKQLRDEGVIVVLPWGFGKWWFGRGRTIRQVIETSGPGDIYLGDSRLRPATCCNTDIFQLARSRGIGILQGSDPLPLAGQESVIAGYGMVLHGDFDHDNPISSLKYLLADVDSHATTFGGHASIMEVAGLQVRMFLHNQAKKLLKKVGMKRT